MTILEYWIGEMEVEFITPRQLIRVIKHTPDSLALKEWEACTVCKLDDEIEVADKFICNKCGTIKPF